MLDILIIDDSPKKIKCVKDILFSLSGLELRVDTSSDITTAERQLLVTQYDIVLLDLFIPYEYGQVADPDNALNFLHHIMVEDDFYKPYFIIGITEKEETEKYCKNFEEHLYYLLKYEENDDNWKDALIQKTYYLNSVKSKIQHEIKYDYDIALITALDRPELEAILRIDNCKWSKIEDICNDETTEYWAARIDNKDHKPLRLVCAHADQMGMCASSLLTSKMIYTFHPRYIIMTGICAATDTNVKLGDIIVANQTFDGYSGKFKDIDEDKTVLFMPDYNPEILEAKIKTKTEHYIRERKVLDEISNSFPLNQGKPDVRLGLHCGNVVSVPAVIQSTEEVDRIKKHCRKLLALDMESYGVYYAAKHAITPQPIPISIKAASDYADNKKNDNYQEYCSFISAKFAFHLIVNDLF